MQYTLTMTSRMLAIAVLCVFLLCMLLFLLGMELGKRLVESPAPAATVSLPAAVPQVPAVPAMPAAPALPAAPAAPTMPAAPAAVAKP